MEARLLCSFYHESLRTWIKTIVNKFAISNHTALILGVHAFRSYLKLIYEYELHSLPNKKLVAQRTNYIEVRPPLVRRLFHCKKHIFSVKTLEKLYCSSISWRKHFFPVKLCASAFIPNNPVRQKKRFYLTHRCTLSLGGTLW